MSFGLKLKFNILTWRKGISYFTPIFHDVPMQNRISHFDESKNKQKRKVSCCGRRNAISVIECAPRYREDLR